MFENPSNDTIRDLLKNAANIAVVGLSDKPNRESYLVAAEMQKRGYHIIPVNPKVTEVLGEKAFPSLKDIPEKVDIIDVFRNSEALYAVVEEAVQTDCPVIWAQQGIYNEDAAQLAKDHDKTMIMDRCIMVMHSLLVKGAS